MCSFMPGNHAAICCPEVHDGQPGAAKGENGEIHPGEVVGGKISLSERFGLW